MNPWLITIAATITVIFTVAAVWAVYDWRRRIQHQRRVRQRLIDAGLLQVGHRDRR